jgi:hypothetical protein
MIRTKKAEGLAAKKPDSRVAALLNAVRGGGARVINVLEARDARALIDALRKEEGANAHRLVEQADGSCIIRDQFTQPDGVVINLFHAGR